jgi:transcriptional regulator with XRE-family HTH domain
MTGKEIRELFSANLKYYRTRDGISQLNLATELGMAPNFISDIECGKKWISPDTLSKLARALHVEPYQFFMQDQEIPDDTAAMLRSFTDDLTQTLKSTAESLRDRYLDSK